MKKLFATLLTLLSLSPIAGECQVRLDAKEIARRSLPSVALIVCTNAKGKIVQGSGFFIAAGVVVTNDHVVRGATRCALRTASGGLQETIFDVTKITASDAESDLALLDVPAAKSAGVPVLTLAPESYRTQIGETIYVLGNPKGLQGSMSTGIIAAETRLEKKQALLQITAPISQGSSGGPVINELGEVIGVAVASLTGGQNLNFAVPITLVRSIARGIALPTPPIDKPVQAPASSRRSIEPLENGDGLKSKSIAEIASDQIGFIDQVLTVRATIKLSASYAAGYLGADDTHYAFMLTDSSYQTGYVYMTRTEKSSDLRQRIIANNGKLEGMYTIQIKKERYKKGWSMLIAELLDFELKQ